MSIYVYIYIYICIYIYIDILYIYQISINILRHLVTHSDQTSCLGNSRNSGLYSSSMKSAATDDMQLPIVTEMNLCQVSLKW